MKGHILIGLSCLLSFDWFTITYILLQLQGSASLFLVLKMTLVKARPIRVHLQFNIICVIINVSALFILQISL